MELAQGHLDTYMFVLCVTTVFLSRGNMYQAFLFCKATRLRDLYKDRVYIVPSMRHIIATAISKVGESRGSIIANARSIMPKSRRNRAIQGMRKVSNGLEMRRKGKTPVGAIKLRPPKSLAYAALSKST